MHRSIAILLISLGSLTACDIDCPESEKDKDGECPGELVVELLFPSPYSEESGAPGTLLYGWYVGNTDSGAYCAHEQQVATGEAFYPESVVAEVWDEAASYVPEGIYLAVPWGLDDTVTPTVTSGTAWYGHLTGTESSSAVSADGTYTLHVAKTDRNDTAYSCETETPGILMLAKGTESPASATAPSPVPPASEDGHCTSGQPLSGTFSLEPRGRFSHLQRVDAPAAWAGFAVDEIEVIDGWVRLDGHLVEEGEILTLSEPVYADNAVLNGTGTVQLSGTCPSSRPSQDRFTAPATVYSTEYLDHPWLLYDLGDIAVIKPFGSAGYYGVTLDTDGSFHWTPTDLDLDLSGTFVDGVLTVAGHVEGTPVDESRVLDFVEVID